VGLVHVAEPGTLAVVPQTDASAFDTAPAVTRSDGGGLLADLDPGWDVGGGILKRRLPAVCGRPGRSAGEPAPTGGSAADENPSDPVIGAEA
jgi:hypothetical protein